MIDLILAISPIIVIIILLFVAKKPIIIAAPITFLYTAALALFNIQGILPVTWAMMPRYAFASSLKGLFTAVDITIIILGAIFFLEFLKETKIIQSIEHYLQSISTDQRIQGIILTWFLCSFIEGTAGFGTPAAIVAPLLVAIGFMPITAVTISLIADSTAVAFGAVGTPIRIGFAGLEVAGVPFYTALINMIAGLIVPILILIIIVYSSKKRNWTSVKEMIPFSLWAGIVLLVPYFLSSFLGQEFPSLIGPLIGLAIIIYTTKKGFLVPKNIWKFKENKVKLQKHTKTKTFLPYILLVFLLLAGKYVFPKFSYNIIAPIGHSINTFNPGIIFILTIIIFSIIYKDTWSKFLPSLKEASKILLKPFVAILFIVAFVQIMVNSNLNLIGTQSMIDIIANYMQTKALPFLAPFIGGFGAAISGSATVSNLLFGQFQYQTATTLGISTAIILALQTIGAAAGNMVSLTNIVAAQATVKLHGKDAEILKRTIIPCLLYLFVAGILGLILISL
ncbi:L-lactate permease [Candidatus Woesearchaeota archaeon]|nr:L-lactate permease [Candidatus Woesearchaeota archaeon]MCF7901708.1 L-lactate permease [Candidatus Woesearchaeota archaeon]MCF8014014.1 L-lactate permease [Candidatus Woesearchaeota archaeon]